MAFKKDAQLIFRYIIVLLLVGVLCYAAFPQKTPDEPVRIVMRNLGGKVIFDHKTHASAEGGYGLECSDCHHNILDDGGDPESCEDCHEKDSDSTNTHHCTLVFTIVRTAVFQLDCSSPSRHLFNNPDRKTKQFRNLREFSPLNI